MTQATELRELASLIRVNGGNVGIGPLTADPPYTLSLGQTNVAGAQTIRLAGNGNPKHEIQFREAGVDYGFTIRYAGDATDNKLHIVAHENDTNGTEAITISRSTGKVGIGNTAPDHQLDVEGGNNVFDIARFGSSNSDNSEVTIGYFDANATNGIPALITASDFGGLIQGGEHGHLVLGIRDNDTTDALDIISGGGNFMSDSTYDTLIASFKADGKVGIGHNAPTHTLHVNTSGTGVYIQREVSSNAANLSEFNSNRSLIIKNRAGGSFLMFGGNGSRTDIQASDGDGTPTAKDIALNPFGGNVGIGTYSPTTELEVAGTAKADQYLIDALAKDISDTAVDVFVYDTRKDSDGGAWRKRTQHTSWYNETLNTSTRGSRKEFPCVAVLVYEEDQLTIYDGDDPDLPMWLVINAGGGDPLYAGGTSNACEALNGEIIAGNGDAGTAGSLGHFNFIKDFAYLRVNTTGAYNGVSIVNRNSGWPSDTITGVTEALVDRDINDVAMTILPNAPIDADTGLPVPTIAVATNGGVSVIKDDGTVVDIVSSYLGHETPMQVRFIGDRVFWLGQNNYDNGWSSAFTAKIPSADVSVNYNTGVGSLTKYTSSEWSTDSFRSTNGSDILIPIRMDSPRSSVLLEAGKDDELIFGGKEADDHGTVVKVVENLADPESGMLTQIASDFATGYQVGDIKLATLSSTDTTNAVGVEILTNTDFTSGTSPWVADQATISAGSNKLTITPNSGVNGGVYHAITTVAGKTYVYQLKVLADASNFARMYAGTSNSITSANKSDLASKLSLGNGTHSITFVATGTTTYIWIEVGGGTQQATEFDDATVRLAEEDRSYNSNGLQVFGTVTKTAVATGADLVAYSGFSASNYLQQPYNSDLDFGTGDFSINLWVKGGSTGTVVFDRLGADQNGLQGSSTDQTKRLYIYTNSNRWEFIAGQTGITAAEALIDISSDWKLLTCIRKNGVMSMYENGVHKHSKANTNSVGDTDHITRIGTGILWNISPHSGSVALVRVSATAPSAESIKKMYHDEKHLFTTNAKATLYGSSDAVTALAYDDDTELLHVGTSAGRSVFQGLNRVDNTTDAVSTAISASNGLVAED